MLRVGSVPYLVGRPLDAGMEDDPRIEFHRDVPARLVEGLRAGTIDVALVSSIELFRHPGATYLEHLVVAGGGHVSSVQVFLRRTVREVRTVALDPSSRTAAALTRVVWPERQGAPPPDFVEVERGADPRGAGTDAWLRIGDRALIETAEQGARPVFNPSAAWAERTGLPFVFALWIARAGVDLAPHVDVFLRGRERGRAGLAGFVEREAQALGLEPSFLQAYLRHECLFELDACLGRSLRAFGDAAAELGIARADLEPRGIPIARRLSE